MADRVARTRTVQGGFEGVAVGHDPISNGLLSGKHQYREVAFVASGKARHAVAAQEYAVWLNEKSPINLTPLNRANENVWRGRYDLVIAGSEEPSGFKDVFLGNTERELVRYCPSDVLIVRNRPLEPPRRIVVAIAPDPMDDRQTRLASKTMQAAAAFDDWDDCELNVVNVAPSTRYDVLALNAGFSIDEAKRIEAEARLNQEYLVYPFLDDLKIRRNRINLHLLEGNPVQKITDLVSRLDADLLVIGSAGRRGIGRLLIGNTAEKIIRQVACSYLVTKLVES